MADNKPENSNGFPLDHELDAALARYATIEPRAGLESRILANLHVAGEKRMERAWWSWTTAGVVAFVIVMVAGTAWHYGKAHRDPVAREPMIHVQPQAQRSGSNGSIQQQAVGTLKPRAKPHSVRVHDKLANAHPKLEQFPSPQPLSEQEKLLANYVADYPTHAAQIAQARAAALLQDSQEELATNSSGTR